MIPIVLSQKKLETLPLSRNKRKLESLKKNKGLSPLRRSDSGGESFRSSSSSYKRCVEHNNLKVNGEKKRKKIKLLTQVTMESGKAKAHPEPCVVKRKRMTGHSFKALLRGKCVKKTVSVQLPLAQSEKHPSDHGTEEQVNSVDSKKQHLKRIHTQGSQNSIDSVGDQLSTEEDIDQEISNVDGQRLLSSSLQLKNVKMKIENNSAKQDYGENRILSQQKHAVKDKYSGSEIDSLINELQKKCHNRRRKLIQKQLEETQEFHQTWDKKRLKMKQDHELELTVVRAIYGGGSARLQDKLKLLDGKFTEKIVEHNLLKDMQLKELEAKQLAARNEETQKEALWLAKANACRSSDIRAVYGPQSHGLQSEDVGGFSQASAHILGAKDVMALTRHHMDDNYPSKSVQDNDVSLSEKSLGGAAQKVGCNVSIGHSSNFTSADLQNDIGVAFSQRSILAGVEQLNQPKAFGTLKSVPGEIQPVEQNHEVPQEVPETVPNEIVDFDNPVEMSNNTSNKGIDETNAIHLSDASENQGDDLDETPTGGLPIVGHILEPSMQTKASPYPCALVLPLVSQDQMQPCSISDEIQDQGALVVEMQNTSALEVAASEHIDTSTIFQNSVELQDQDSSAVEDQVASLIEVANSELVAPIVGDQVALQIEVANSEQVDLVNPLQSNVDAPPIEDCVELHILAIDVSPSCNQPPSIEVESQSHNMERNSSQTAEIADTLVLSNESASQLGENHEPQSMHFGIRSESEVVEPSISSQNTGSLSEMVASEVELEHKADLQLGSLDHLYGSSFLFFNPNHLFDSPLEHYLEQICEEIEQLPKNREDTMSQLKADREKEIQETLAQIHNKYDMKVQEAKAEFRCKQNRLNKNQRKVLMNNVFALAFSSSCLGHWSYGLPELQHGTPHSTMQQQQQPLQHLVRPPSLDHPSPRQPISVSILQGMQQLLPPRSMMHNSVTASPVQVAQHAVALSFGPTSQPPAISAITPMANPCFGGEFRSQALHLQPRAASSMPTTTFPSIPQYFQQLRPSQPLQSPPTAVPPQQHPSSTFQNRPQHQSEPPAVLTPSLSALEYLIDVNDCANVHGNLVSSSVPEMSSIFDSLEQSTHGIMLGNRTSSAVATDVICLSDDDLHM